MTTESGNLPLANYRWFVDKLLDEDDHNSFRFKDSQKRIRVRDYYIVVNKLFREYSNNCRRETLVREPGRNPRSHKGNPFNPGVIERQYFINGGFVVLDLKTDFNSLRAVRVYHSDLGSVMSLASNFDLFSK